MKTKLKFSKINYHQIKRKIIKNQTLKKIILNPIQINNYYDDDAGAALAIQAVEQQIMDEICPNPDKMTYEQLLAMEEKVGNVNKGLNKDKINKIPIVNFKKNYYKDNNKCVICQEDFRDFEKVKKLGCEHLFHINCIDQWLKKDKKCPFCNKEI